MTDTKKELTVGQKRKMIYNEANCLYENALEWMRLVVHEEGIDEKEHLFHVEMCEKALANIIRALRS